MEGREGPGKVLEQEAHSERVDSIQWSNNPRLKFVSGSKDGTARIWSFRSGCWNSSVLKVTASDGRTVIFNKAIIDSDDTYYYSNLNHLKRGTLQSFPLKKSDVLLNALDMI